MASANPMLRERVAALRDKTLERYGRPGMNYDLPASDPLVLAWNRLDRVLDRVVAEAELIA